MPPRLQELADALKPIIAAIPGGRRRPFPARRCAHPFWNLKSASPPARYAPDSLGGLRMGAAPFEPSAFCVIEARNSA